MNNDLGDKLILVVVVFVMTSLAAAYFYGMTAVITCVLGLILFGIAAYAVLGGRGH
ncbi:MAG: hypothetical protein RIC55_12280 [Pirellulaceae bacterium]